MIIRVALQELKLYEWKANASDAFNLFLQGLESLITRTIQKRLEKKYSWLLTFVTSLEHVLETRMNAENMLKEEVESQITDIRKQLKLAQKDLTRCGEVQIMIDKKSEMLLQELREYLTKDSVKSKLLDWTNIAPESKEQRALCSELIKTRLQDVILEWVSAETGPLKLASATITDKFKELRADIDLRIGAIHKHELGLHSLESLDVDHSLNRMEITMITLQSLLCVIGASLLYAFKLFGSAFNWLMSKSKALDERVRQLFVQNLSDMTEKAMLELLKKENLEKIITASFTHLHGHLLTKFHRVTQRKLLSALEVMLQLESDLKKKRGTLTMLRPLYTELQKLSKRLKE